jgi:hypothetical protein
MKYLFSLLILCASYQVQAQSADEKGVKTVIDQLFTAMRTGDTALLAASFAPAAMMQTIVQKNDGSVVVRTDAVSGFVTSVGKPHPDVYDERISYEAIHIDGNLAAAWTPYQFYIGSKFSHCGVNSFQLVKISGEWKIQYIIDTRRKENCIVK